MNTEEQSNSGEDSNQSTNKEGIGPLNTESLAALLREETEANTSEQAPAEADSNEAEVHHEEAEAEGSAETNEDGEEVPSQTEEQTEDQEAEDLPRGVQKRINKLTALRKKAEAEIERLKTELEDAKSKAKQIAEAPVQTDNPYFHLDSPEKVQSEMKKARDVRYWAEENSDGCVINNPDGTETEYTARQVREIKLNAMKALEEHLPKQAAFLAQKAQMDTYAESEYSWWKKEEARERQIAEKFISAFPEIRRFPDYKVVIGDYITGLRTREARLKQNSGQVSRAPVVPRSTSAPANLSPRDKSAKESKQRFMSTTSSEDLADYLKTIL